jgi:tetratricopeptide (TPR) repeat protein
MRLPRVRLTVWVLIPHLAALTTSTAATAFGESLPERGRLESAIRKVERAVFYIGSRSGWPDGPEGDSFGTAFLISRRHRLLATAAHIADKANKGGVLTAVPSGSTFEYRVDRVWYHPGVLRRFGLGLYAPSMDPNDGTVVWFPTADVAILHLAAGGPELPQECELASDSELKSLDHDDVGLIGFTVSEEGGGTLPSESEKAAASSTTAKIARSADYSRNRFFGDESTPRSERRWLMTDKLLGHGSSGGPLLLGNGHVIGLGTGEAHQFEGEVYQEFVRIDLVRQALAYNGLQMSAVDLPAAGAVRADRDHEVLVGRIRRAIGLVNEGAALASEGRYREAVERCNLAVRIIPDFGGAYLKRAEVYLRYCSAAWDKLTKEQKLLFVGFASADLGRGFALLGENSVVPSVIQSYINLYYDLLQPWRADIPRNIEFINEILNINYYDLYGSNNAALLACRAFCQDAIGDLIGARVDYDEAIRLDPGEPLWYLERARFWVRRNRPGLAAADRATAEQLSPRRAGGSRPSGPRGDRSAGRLSPALRGTDTRAGQRARQTAAP